MNPDIISAHYFQRLDNILLAAAIKPLSLHPHKTQATSFAVLGSLVIENIQNFQVVELLQNTLESILYSLLENFRENIFWDFDFLVSSMVKQSLQADNAIDFLHAYDRRMIELLELFGKKSEIRFRYIHDFMYGYDWAKWVQKEPCVRANIEPFSIDFLDYLLKRGQEILQLINKNDSKYYHLSDRTHRNPFCFSRELDDERLLWTSLASQGFIPVAGWNWNACPVWNKPFHELREQLSFKLNLSKK